MEAEVIIPINNGLECAECGHKAIPRPGTLADAVMCTVCRWVYKVVRTESGVALVQAYRMPEDAAWRT